MASQQGNPHLRANRPVTEPQGLTREVFRFTSRGRIPAKNKGEVEMFFVDGLLPELAADSRGRRAHARNADTEGPAIPPAGLYGCGISGPAPHQ